MKIRNFVMFLKKSLKINMIKIKNIAKLENSVIKQMIIEMLHVPYVI